MIQTLARAAPAMIGYLGDRMSCVPGSGAMLHAEIDLEVTLGILEWEDVIRSLRYCNSDEHPVNGTRTITFRIQDPALAWSDNQTATVEVFSINDAPICDTPVNFFTIDEDFNITIPVLANCFDHEEILTGTSIVIYSQPTPGQAVVDPTNGDITFLPAEHDYGTRTFAYQACDIRGACSIPQVVTVVINPINDPPYARDNLTLIVQEDTTVVVRLSELYFFDVEDDLVPNNDFPRIVNATGSSGGNWFLRGEGPNATFEYTPFPNFVGRDQIIIDVCDSDNACVQITIVIVVQSINDLPLVEIRYPSGTSEVVTMEDVPVSVEIFIVDVENRVPVRVDIISVGNGTAYPDNSSISLSLEPITDRQLQTMNIVYSPDFNFYGEDSITFAAVDSDGGITEATIDVRVTYVNDPPEFALTDFTILEDEVRVWRLPLDFDVTDPEDILNAGSFSIAQQPTLGRVEYRYNESAYNLTGSFPSYGELFYYPPEHYFTQENETIDFVVQACDHDALQDILCSNATIRVTIISDNDAPHLPQVPLFVYEDRIGLLYLWNFTFDVEEGRPPVENISLIEPLPQLGVAEYNSTTGYLTYIPYDNVFGTDYVYYNACDAQNHCSMLRGEVVVSVLRVNDRPMALNFSHVSREDDYDLIGFFDNITDIENANLRIEILNSNETYVDEWTTPIGGRLRVYHAHQVITYLPPRDYVGPDSFKYAVCDTCDPRRDRELGRVTPDPECQRQIEENRNSILESGSNRVFITCAEAVVTIYVTNVNDVPVARNMSGSTAVGVPITFTPFEDSVVISALPDLNDTMTYFYRNTSSFVYDSDDRQAYEGLRNRLNLSLYNLVPNTDINETSLSVIRQPMTGSVELSVVNGITSVTYTPNVNSSGYDFFRYEICDNLRMGERSSRCSGATASIFISRQGPQIVSIVANGSASPLDSSVFSDSKVSRGDTITIEFSEATNMPPFGQIGEVLAASDVDMLFDFDEPYFLDAITKNPYEGKWLTPTTFELTFVDTGYPQPFISNVTIGAELFTEIKIGEWKVSVAPNPGPCGGFDTNGQRIEDIDRYCLLNENQTTLSSQSISSPLAGHFGLKLPNISNVILSNVAVEDDVITLNDKALFVNSHIAVHLQEPLSYAQLSLYCEKDPKEIVDVPKLGDSVKLSVVGCANLLSDGTNANEKFEDNIQLMRDTFSKFPGKRKRRDTTDEDNSELERTRRQTIENVFVPSQQPVVSEIILQANEMKSSQVDPLKDPGGFVNLIQQSLNYTTIASVVSETHGIPIETLIQYSITSARLTNPYYYYHYDNELTPQITQVIAADPDNEDDMYSAGDTITVFFDRETDQPEVGTRRDLDMIFMFDPSLGSDYIGEWVTPMQLQITVVDPSRDEGVLLPTIENLIISFRPNFFHTNDEVTSDNTIVPTDTPWCIGINVCGRNTTNAAPLRSVGICDSERLSCRAYQGVVSIEGNFGTGEPIIDYLFPFWWIIIAIVVVILIAILIVVIYFVYRHYKLRAQRAEAKKVVERWRKDRFAPGKEAEKKEDGPKPWVKPPDVATMRENPDPFGAINKLPPVVPRPQTAMMDVENLPPVPRQPFKPREPASIRPILGGGPPPLLLPPRSRQSLSIQPGTLPALPSRPSTISGLPAPLPLPTPQGRPSVSSIGSLRLGSQPAAPMKLSAPSPAAPPPQLGLPPLAAVSGETPSRMDTRPVLKPLRGPGLAAQAGRALGSEPGASGAQQPLPGAIMPRRLTPLTSIPEERGKGPLGGKPFPKKLIPPAGAAGKGEEGTDGAAKGGASPPFETTRPLPPISGGLGGPSAAAPLPSIGGSNLPPLDPGIKKLPTPLPLLTQRPGVPSMPSRQAPSDPFSSDTPTRASPAPAMTRLPPTRPGRAPPTPFASTSPKKPATTSPGGGGGQGGESAE